MKFEIVENEWANGESILVTNLTEKSLNIKQLDILIEYIKEINCLYDPTTGYSTFSFDRPNPGWIYLIGNENYWKIGRSTKFPITRLSGLQTGNPLNLECAACWYVRNHVIAEKLAHQKLNDFKVRGEWFMCEKNNILDALLYQNACYHSEEVQP